MTGDNVQVADKVTGNAGHSDLVTVAEAAARLGKSDRTIRRMIASGKLATVDIGGAMHIQLAGVDALDSVTGTPDKVTGASVQTPDNAGQSDRRMSDPGTAALVDLVRRQDEEISYLRAMLEKVTLMLPAPSGAHGEPGRSGPVLPKWVIVVLCCAAAALAGYWVIGGLWIYLLRPYV